MMTALPTHLVDSRTMLGRNLRHARRYPTIVFIVGVPVFFLLLFVYVFGGTLGAGLGGVSAGRDAYVAYVVPGILVLTVAGAATGTAIAMAMDMTEGIVTRFRTMSVSRSAFLVGHVLSSVLQTMLGVTIVAVVAVFIGFRASTDPIAWVAAAGLLALTAIALTWLSVALGLMSSSVAVASNLPLPLTLLVFFGSGFVPAASMPEPLATFAANQPFTTITETLRGLLLGTSVGNEGLIAVAWCIAISVVGYLWSVRLYARDPEH